MNAPTSMLRSPRPLAAPAPAVAIVAAAALGLLVPAPAAAWQAAATDRQAAVDAVFAEYEGTEIPGCTVGVSEGDAITLERAYGMADLEHDVANTPISVFEAGSVSKQFTAAATILLALEGKISLDDDIRTHFPELPDYGEPITIRHLLNHTSGLRDWGSVAGIHGWPRTTRVHDHGHALDIIARQRELNYPPGTHYSYTNSGYNLQAMLVERVTGQSFADFSRERLFEPLGMTRTEWRDDYRRIVEDRAIAYRPVGSGGFFMDMPFEQVHGNGGLLTTVGDLLRWTRNLETGEVGGPDLLEELHRQGVLRSGRTISYASGLVHGDYRGVGEVQHGGATAGYRAFLTRFPGQGVAVAVLCNRADANTGALAHEVADVYLEGIVADEEPEEAAFEVDPATLQALAGAYRNTRSHGLFRLEVREGTLRADGRAPLRPVAPGEFRLGGGRLIVDGAAGAATGDGGRAAADAGGGSDRRGFIVIDSDADTVRFEPVEPFAPSPSSLEEYTGPWHSPEAEVTWTAEVRDGGLVLVDRYGEVIPLTPLYADTFGGRGSTFRFLRDDAGAVSEMRLGQSRVWALRFERGR